MDERDPETTMLGIALLFAATFGAGLLLGFIVGWVAS
jgi:hypothetical protein